MAMSSDTANLVLRVDATQTDAGAKSLDKLTASADNADKSVKQLGETSEQQTARLKAMVAASMDKVRAQQAEIDANKKSEKTTDAQRAALDALNKSSNTQADMNARGAAILAAEERARKAATVGIADQTAGLAQLIGKIDPSVAALERLDAMQAKLAAFKKSGAISGEDFAIYSAKIEEARAAVGKTATSMHTLTLNSSLARRELGRMGTDIATGNFGRLSQTSLTLANYTGLMGLAFTAAGAAILGTVAVVGTFIAAAAKGWAETERLRVSIIATGGAAGVTADQLNAMAESVGKTTGEYGDARKAIEQLAASGKVAGAGLGGLAEQAVNMSKVTGESVEQSAAKILELADKPAQTIAKLNEQYHFLTASQYAQIAALEAEGKVREASRLANQLDAQAMKARAQDVQDNAGWMIKAGHAVAEAWGKAWDAMKGVGRKEDLGQVASALEDQIKELSGVHFVGSVAMPGLNSDDPRLAKLRTQLAAIRHEQTVAAFKANADYLEAAKNADAIAAQQAGAAFDSPDIKRKNEIAKANKTLVDSLAGAVTEEQRAQYRTRYANQVTAANQAYESAVKQGRPSASGGGGGSKADPFASLNSLVQGAQVKDNTFGTAGQTQQVTSILAIVDAGAKLIASGHDVEAVQAKVAVGVAAVNDLYAKQADQLKTKNVAALNDYIGVQEAKLKTSQQALDLQVASIGMGDREIALQRQIIDIQREADRDLQRLNKERATLTDTEYQQKLAVIKTYEDKRVAAAYNADERIRAAQGDWTSGFSKAFTNYIDQASDVAGQSATVFSNAFNSMGDALGNFATTGKLNFKGLVTSILGDLAKMEARIALSKILQSVLGAFLGNSGGNGQMATSFNSDNTFFSPYAKGDVFSSSPSLSAYSSQVVSQPTMFAFARGAGVMGEAGPEAIMPLKRGSDGKLGVVAQGGGGIQLSQTFVIDGKGQSTDSATGSSSDDAFRQLATRMKDTAKQAIMEEQRQGGSIWRLMHS